MKKRFTPCAAMCTALATLAVPVGAQSAAAFGSERWSPFLGCWSTSSGGTIGPMVCIVPGDSLHQVEFLTVSGDSVVARTRVDASGKAKAYRRHDCFGAESSRWSADGRRLFMHADYSCGKSGVRQSDALIDRTHSDAFTYVERSVKDARQPARIVNFIVQLDTTIFPAEVKRRLPGVRPLALESSELETREPVATSAIVEAATELDPSLVDAWLEDRGESGLFAIADYKRRETNVDRRAWLHRDLRRGTLFSLDTYSRTAYDGPWGVNWGAEFPTNYLVTPEMVGFGLPYAGYSGGFTWSGWR